MRCGVVLLFAVVFLQSGATVPLSATIDDQVQENFNLTRFLGTWYAIAAACDCSWIMKFKDKLTVSKITLSQSEDHKLIGTYQYDRNGTCVNVTGHYEIQTSPGHFILTSISAHANSTDIQVSETNYNEYALLVYGRMVHLNQTKSLALYGRTHKLTKEIKEKFKQFVLKHGIPEDMLLFLPVRGACLPWDPIPDSPVQDRVRRTLGEEEEEGSAFGQIMNRTRAADFCYLKPDAGPCFGFQRKVFYNQTSMTCEIFNYGGCLGNSNNFKSYRECLQTCRTVGEDEPKRV